VDVALRAAFDEGILGGLGEGTSRGANEGNGNMLRTSLYHAAVCGLSLLALLLQTGVPAAGNSWANEWQSRTPDAGSQIRSAAGEPAGNSWDNTGPDQHSQIEQADGDPVGNW
jgi:hypothetical protein